MHTMLEELKLRLDRANARRTLDDPLPATAHVGLFSLDGHGDAEQINCAKVTKIGADYIEIDGRRLISQRDLREVTPINF